MDSIALDPVPAVVLGPIECLVGSGQQMFGQCLIALGDVLGRQHGEPDGNRYLDRMPGTGLEWFFFDAAANPFGNLTGVVQFGARQQYNKFFSSITGNRIARSQLRLNFIGDLAQYLIPGWVSVRIVDLLEPVDVEEHASECMLVPAGLVDLYRAAMLEVTAVLHAREGIGQAKHFQSFLGKRTFQADGDDFR